MAYNGFNSATLTSLAQGPGVFTKGGTWTATACTGAALFGVTNGGSRINVAPTYGTVEMDGVPRDRGVKGTRRITGHNGTISTSLIQWDNATLATMFGGTFSGAVMTLPDAYTFLSAGAWITDLALWILRSDNKWIVTRFFAAFPTVGEVTIPSEGEALLPATFEADRSPNGTFSNLTSAPFDIRVYDAFATIV